MTMNDTESQAKQVIADSNANRKKFLQAEIDTCWLALDFATLQLQMGYVEFGQREVRVIEAACQTVLRFLPDIEDAETRAKFTDDIEQVSARLENLKRKLL